MGEGLDDEFHAGIEPALMHEGVACIAGGKHTLNPGQRCRTLSASGQPFIPLGSPTSVKSRSTLDSFSSIAPVRRDLAKTPGNCGSPNQD